jgi:hypothetical protein
VYYVPYNEPEFNGDGIRRTHAYVLVRCAPDLPSFHGGLFGLNLDEDDEPIWEEGDDWYDDVETFEAAVDRWRLKRYEPGQPIQTTGASAD